MDATNQQSFDEALATVTHGHRRDGNAATGPVPLNISVRMWHGDPRADRRQASCVAVGRSSVAGICSPSPERSSVVVLR